MKDGAEIAVTAALPLVMLLLARHGDAVRPRLPLRLIPPDEVAITIRKSKQRGLVSRRKGDKYSYSRRSEPGVGIAA